MATVQVDAALLTDVKNHLDITWEDAATDKKVTEYIQSGMVRLNRLLGTGADYSAPGQPRTMLFEYVRYARDGAMDIFENNYQHLLMGMQHERLVDVYAEEPDET